MTSLSITARRHKCSVHTAREYGLSRRSVFAGVQNDTRVGHPCSRPMNTAVNTGSVYRPKGAENDKAPRSDQGHIQEISN